MPPSAAAARRVAAPYKGIAKKGVGEFASLKQAFDNANKTGEKTYIRLTSDITLQRPYFNSDEINGGCVNQSIIDLIRQNGGITE